MANEINNIRFVFFGTSEFAVYVLDVLAENGMLPSLLITNPDRPKGRGLLLAASPVKLWALKNSIEVIQPEKLDNEFRSALKAKNYNLFLVASYGRIIPASIFEIPRLKTLNIHPSLLPRYRGPTPIENQILADEKKIGVTLIEIDEKVDHGSVVEQERVIPPVWPMERPQLEKLLAEAGAHLFIRILPKWIAGSITAIPQDEMLATFTQKVRKEDARINLESDPYKNFLAIMAYVGQPRAYFTIKKNGKSLRIIITDAHFLDGKLSITKVIPEGKKEISWKEFEREYFTSHGQSPSRNF